MQKINHWTEQIKQLWDASEGKLKVILSGSSSLLMQKGLKESLAGRFEIISAPHWNFEEAQRIFSTSLKDYVNYGCYPGSMRFLPQDKERWGQYVQDSIVEPAIGRDLLQLNPVDRPALLRQVFSIAVTQPAQILSLKKIQGQLQDKGALETIQNYLDLLGFAFLVSGIQKYSTKIIRSKRSSPKVIVHDNALLRAFAKPIDHELTPESFGHYLENTVGARFIEAGWSVYYWNDRDLEVDFVVLGPRGEKWAIEVKSSNCKKADLKGLFEFVKRNPEFEAKLISYIDQEIPGVTTLALNKILKLHK